MQPLYNTGGTCDSATAHWGAHVTLVTRGHCLVFHRSRSQDSVVWTPRSLVDSVNIGPQQEDGTIHQGLGLSEGLHGNAQRLAKQIQPARAVGEKFRSR